MTIVEFDELDHSRKATLILSGIQIGIRKELHCHVLLYKVKSLYVELYYDLMKRKISKMKPISNTEDLNSYFGHSRFILSPCFSFIQPIVYRE